jgi:oxygen-independent coproporphyrinogen-3 oxidase
VSAAGLYAHIPFCLTRCGYCDFNAHAGLDHLHGRYVDALRREAERAASDWTDLPFASIFLGGGTPTTLRPEAIAALIEGFGTSFDLAPGAEITSEANPDTVDAEYLRALRDAGVRRLSFGAQSFDPAVLVALERIHQPSSVRRAYADAREAGFDDVNLDLIYGAFGETLESWRATLVATVELQPEHVSAYALTIEPGTPLGARVASGAVPPPDPDLQALMFEAACEILGEAGYGHYEVSNWALPGRECRHNLGYWEGRPYLGLGAGAHSYRDGLRWWNVRPPTRYVELALAGEDPTGGREHLDAAEARLERIMLAMRLDRGVPLDWVDAETARDHVREGLARLDGDRVALTERGMLLANEVVLSLGG